MSHGSVVKLLIVQLALPQTTDKNVNFKKVNVGTEKYLQLVAVTLICLPCAILACSEIGTCD
jgi:hypothetical protein